LAAGDCAAIARAANDDVVPVRPRRGTPEPPPDPERQVVALVRRDHLAVDENFERIRAMMAGDIRDQASGGRGTQPECRSSRRYRAADAEQDPRSEKPAGRRHPPIAQQ
jgi:hypothetical protein